MINKKIEKLALKKLENIDLNLQQKQTLLDVMSIISKDIAINVTDWSIKNDYYKKINEKYNVKYDKCLEIKNLTNEYNKVTFKISDGYLYKTNIANDLYCDGDAIETVDYINGQVNNSYEYILNPYEIIYVNGKGNVLFEKAVKLKGTVGNYNNSPVNFYFNNGEVIIDNNTGDIIKYISNGINNIVDVTELNVIVYSAIAMFADNIFLKESPNIYITKQDDSIDLESIAYFDYMFYNCKSLEKVYIYEDYRDIGDDGIQHHTYSLDKMLYGTKGGNIYNFTKTVTETNLIDNKAKVNDYTYLVIDESYDISDVIWNIHNEFYLTEIRGKKEDGVIWSIDYIGENNTINTPYYNVILATTDIPSDRACWKIVSEADAGIMMKNISNLFPNNRIVYYKHVYIKDCVTKNDFISKYSNKIKYDENNNIIFNIKDIDFIPYYNIKNTECFVLTLNMFTYISVRLIGDLATFNGHETGYVCTNYLNENNNSQISILNGVINGEVNIDEATFFYTNCTFANSSIHEVKNGFTIKGKDLRKSKLDFSYSNGTVNYNINNISGGIFTNAFKQCKITLPDISTIINVDQYDSFVQMFMYNNKITFIDLSNINSIQSNNGTVCKFWEMFKSADNLKEVIVPNIKEWNTDAFNDWLINAGSAVTGDKIIRKPVGLDIPNGNSGIPDGWIVKEYYKGPVYLKNESDEIATFIVGDTLQYPIKLEYSLDNNEYKKYDLDNKPIIEIQPNQSIYLRGINTNIEFTKELHFKFKLDKTFSSGGDPKYLLNYKDINSIKEIPAYCFNGCFTNSEEIIKCDWDMSKITKINTMGCCGMFNDCTNLISVFDFPDLISVDYQGLLYYCNNCTSLEKGSEFPKLKTIRFKGCHYCFYNCISMKNYNTNFSTVIDIDEFAFCGMFYGDKNITTKFDFRGIKEVKNKAFQNITRGTTITEIITPDINTWNDANFINWLPYKSSGTIYKPANLTIPAGEGGVPNGWTTKNYGE